MNIAAGKEGTEYFVNNGILQIKPLSYMRGQTFTDAAIIVDEAQNITHKQMEMLIGRLGVRSKMMICGDMRQKDLENRKKSGLPFLVSLANKVPTLNKVELTSNHRHGVVDDILNFYESEK